LQDANHEQSLPNASNLLANAHGAYGISCQFLVVPTLAGALWYPTIGARFLREERFKDTMYRTPGFIHA